MTSEPNWIPFSKEQNVNISNIGNNASQLYLIRGESHDQNAGFNSYNKFYRDYIVIDIGNVEMTNKLNTDIEPQFTISFNIQGLKENYTLTLVNGRFMESGWSNQTYYEQINSTESKLVNLPELLNSRNDTYISLEKVTLGMEKNTRIDSVVFNMIFVDNKIPDVKIKGTNKVR